MVEILSSCCRSVMVKDGYWKCPVCGKYDLTMSVLSYNRERKPRGQRFNQVFIYGIRAMFHGGLCNGK